MASMGFLPLVPLHARGLEHATPPFGRGSAVSAALVAGKRPKRIQELRKAPVSDSLQLSSALRMQRQPKLPNIRASARAASPAEQLSDPVAARSRVQALAVPSIVPLPAIGSTGQLPHSTRLRPSFRDAPAPIPAPLLFVQELRRLPLPHETRRPPPPAVDESHLLPPPVSDETAERQAAAGAPSQSELPALLFFDEQVQLPGARLPARVQRRALEEPPQPHSAEVIKACHEIIYAKIEAEIEAQLAHDGRSAVGLDEVASTYLATSARAGHQKIRGGTRPCLRAYHAHSRVSRTCSRVHGTC